MKNVEDVLIDMGIYPNLSGFRYICKAVSLISENRSTKICDVYKAVAEEYHTSVSGAERGIIHAFSKADKDCETYKHYMSVKDTSNSAMLFTLAERLKES